MEGSSGQCSAREICVGCLFEWPTCKLSFCFCFFLRYDSNRLISNSSIIRAYLAPFVSSHASLLCPRGVVSCPRLFFQGRRNGIGCGNINWPSSFSSIAHTPSHRRLASSGPVQALSLIQHRYKKISLEHESLRYVWGFCCTKYTYIPSPISAKLPAGPCGAPWCGTGGARISATVEFGGWGYHVGMITEKNVFRLAPEIQGTGLAR